VARTVDAAFRGVTVDADEDTDWYQAYGYDPTGAAAPEGAGDQTPDSGVEGRAELRAAASPSEAEPGGGPAGEAPPLTRGARAGLIVLSAGVAVLLAAGAVFGLQWWGSVAESNRRTEVVDAARQVALNLTSINFESADADVNRVIDGSVGEFRDLFIQNLDSYVEVVKDNEVLTTGQIAESGLSDLTGDVAHVLVAVQSNVRNKAAPDGEVRTYRMDLQMERQGNGSWLVSRVDFVP
jgi:Mce-associated membrane protein